MKLLLITLLITLGLLLSGTALAATRLSDTELAGISGGAIDPPLGGQSLPQEQQQPESNTSGYMPIEQQRTIDGIESAPELFAVLQSRIDAERERRLMLGGTTQRNAMALNLENAISSDTVSSSNIFDGGSLCLDDITSDVEVNQINDLSQLHRTQGNLTSSVANFRYEKSFESRFGTESYEHHAYSYLKQNRIDEYQSTKWRDDQAAVGKRFFSLGEMVPEIISSTQKGWLDLLRFHVNELNHGSGFDIKGNSVLRPITNPDRGSLSILGEANIKVKILWWEWEITVARFEVKKPYTVMDQVVAGGGDPGLHENDVVKQDDNLLAEYKAVDFSESSFNESYEYSVFTGGQLTAAEAELLAMSDGNLSVDNRSMVELGDSAQQNMRIGNGINAVSSVATNAINVSRLPAYRVPRTSLVQQNRFNQQM